MGNKYTRILVALDGSKQAEIAFLKAVELAKATGAKLGIASIVDVRSFSPNLSYDGVLEQLATEEATARLAEYKELAEKAEVTSVTTFLEAGNPKTLLARDIPAEFDADVLICGATGLNRIEKIVLGSVSAYVLQHAICDVLVVREK
ncbi:universal stress protein [Listeria booriae]|uniref:Universal stress protein n=1 Tax=Listeria booriae TaxID=1552123 RepID=A0A099W2V5_9LIST|nr:universal stress protein [Listeria booriae]KGL39026.1 universal stress protein UspA [Listeria booriae]MBC1211416.1 universal stress protein [Listeria booriae]MBC1332707.1 universal stress protein [Listeria booriae]MBC1359161.1 universal stress protein [Listeria booriae]MBC1373692.1 universal stress protein [Listeria booriae]